MDFQPFRYTVLGDEFAVPTSRYAFTQSTMLLWNDRVANHYRWPLDLPSSLALFSGQNQSSSGPSVSLAYCGHQFGHFNPSLGDGRAHLVAQLATVDGGVDVQTKGSGPSRFSRGGDGLSAMGPAIREFIMSDAMWHLGVPTTHCLGVLDTHHEVYRQQREAGGLSVRIADSHIRIGSFQYVAMQHDIEKLNALMELAISRHFGDIKSTGEARVIEFLVAVCQQQARLILQWLRIGFVHGVMNTDNALVSGQTIDYGPCAMMENYSLDTVFSSIDKQGRYAFGQQANIANWNCARLAESLIPLFADEQVAVNKLSEALSAFAVVFNEGYDQLWFDKLGLNNTKVEHQNLVEEFKALLTKTKADYTNTFAALTMSLTKGTFTPYELPELLSDWQTKWAGCVDKAYALPLMLQMNPALIPRNHLVEHAISTTKQGDKTFITDWMVALSTPYDYDNVPEQYVQPAPDGGVGYRTFCGT